VVEHNVTLLSIALREGDAPAEELPVVRVDDTVLEGQAALLRRLTSLVYTTMGELQKAQNHLRQLNEKLTVMAERDALTGVYNRGKIEDLICHALDSSRDHGTPVSLIMVDVDHFKQVNDVYGHHIGDVVLQGIARLIQSVGDTSSGCAGRWGGEEFFLLLPDTGEQEAMMAAEHLRLSVAKRPFPEVGNVTISLGVITVEGEMDRKWVFSRVDDALYQAKEGGRNRTVQAKI
jgi:diguanylate cyclase (GGDEF)-like protein